MAQDVGAARSADPPARRAARRSNLNPWLIVPAGLFILTFLVVPYVNMVRMSFLFRPPGGQISNVVTLANYQRVLADGFYWAILRNTFLYAAVATAITLLLGYPLAMAIARARPRWRPVMLAMLIAPLLVGIVIRSYGWMIILGRVGIVNQFLRAVGIGELPLMYNVFGTIVGLVHIFMPFMALSIAGALQGIAPDVERAARSLGASPWQAFWRVTWPLSLPGVFAGTLLVFVLSVSAYVIPILLGGNNVLVTPMLIVQQLLDAFNWPLGSALAMVMFGFTAVLLWIYVKVMNRALRWVKT
jgi:putative spermidine/putrescine transport system permease protein